MTGASIYLVSACTSGEQFVAAFRRYVDRNGLFVPIDDPIAVGKRGHFALTLRDGGIMIEGDGEVISSGRTPSVLHGRIGMTIRFAELDESSKTVIAELEKARLVMKPPAPSVPPRAAEIPAEPRPVVPAPSGRIDANNALAQVVVIGDIDGLGVAAAPPKAGPKFVVPTIPPVAGTRPKSPSTPPLGRAASASTPPPFSSPPELARPKIPTAPPDLRPKTPTSNPVTSTVPARPRALAPTPPAPIAPPSNPVTATPRVQTPAVTEPARTEPAGSLRPTMVDPPAKPADDAVRGTSATLTAVKPAPPSPSAFSATMPAVKVADIKPPARTPAVQIEVEVDDEVAEIHSGPPSEDDILLGRGIVAGPITREDLPDVSDMELGLAGPTLRTVRVQDAPNETPTQMSAEPPPAATAQVMDAVMPTLTPTGMAVVTPALGRTMTKQGAGDLKPLVSPPPSPSKTPSTEITTIPAPPIVPDKLDVDEPTDLTSVPITASIADDGKPGRKTALGVGVSSAGATVLPAIEPNGTPDTSLMPVAQTDDKPKLPTVEEATPSGDWTIKPGDAGPTIEQRTPARREPSGDWTISLTDEKPMREPPVDAVPIAQPAQPTPTPTPKPKAAKGTGRETRSGEIPIQKAPPQIPDEPKVQIDPTLIEPLTPMSESPGLAMPAPRPTPVPMAPPSQQMAAMQVGPPVAVAHEVPPLMQHMQPAPGAVFTPMPGSIANATSPNLAYQNAMGMGPPQRVVTDGGTGFFRESGDIRNLHDSTSLIPAPRNRRVLVIAISAALAAIAGVVLVVMLTRGSDEQPIKDPVTNPPDAGAARIVKAPIDAAAEAPVPTDAAPVIECFADVTSAPAGAEIVHGKKVLGTTPAKVTLPCGVEVKLTIRKARLTPVTRPVTPTEDGAKVKVVLVKVLFSVKVSSQPAGAKITVNGKPMGITPTTVRVNAFEPATIVLSKDGYVTDTLKVTPKQNNQALQTTLKKKRR